MPELVVQPVETRHQRKLFLSFPWRLYRDDPLWVPPLRRDQAELVGYLPHPFYEKNESQTFLAFRGGEVCGRIAAIDNRVHNEFHGEKRGFFGFFECRDDPEAAGALLDAARQWLLRKGLEAVRGPASPAINYVFGALVEGFDRPPAFMMPYNPPYYGSLLEGYGFRKAQDLYAYYGHVSKLAEVRAKLESVAGQIIERYDIRIRRMSRRRFRQDVAEFVTILNRSLVGHWGYLPFSDSEINYLAKGLSWLLVPEMAVGAEIDGRLVGAAIGLPDYNPRIKRIDGRLFPFGFLRLLLGKKRIKRYRVMAANVLPEYHLHGVGMVLLKALWPSPVSWGAEDVEFSWIAESNSLSRGALEKGGAERIKTYRVYDLDF